MSQPVSVAGGHKTAEAAFGSEPEAYSPPPMKSGRTMRLDQAISDRIHRMGIICLVIENGPRPVSWALRPDRSIAIALGSKPLVVVLRQR